MNLQTFRNPLALETRHPLYRGESDRWLQSIVQQDVTRVDVALLPEQVYEQVFAQTAGQHGILDLLGVTRAGRLAILELKTTKDLDLPLQAADYWSRIRAALGSGRPGSLRLFSRCAIAACAASGLPHCPGAPFSSFHQLLRPEMEVIRIGLAESWRRGLRVMMRQ